MDNIVENRLGFDGIQAQIGEYMFQYKQKYRIGRLPQYNRWIFGIIDNINTPPNYYVNVIPDRRRETLLQIIQRVVHDGSMVVSDEWEGLILQ